jgi:pantoate kinase
MKGVPRRKTLVQEMSEIAAKQVLSDSTRRAIEKMAEEFARDMLADKEFREYLRREATAAAREIAAALREANPKLHGARPR